MQNFYMKKTTIFLFSLFLSTHALFAQPKLTYTSRVSGLSSPIDIVNAGDGSNRIFVVHKEGLIKVYNKASTPAGTLTFIKDFLTVTGLGTGGEEGLLSMAFPPDYASTGYFFVYYVNTSGNLVLARYKVDGTDPNLADPDSREIVLPISHPTNSNHNGAKLQFRGGHLYFGTGDGGGGGDTPNNAQNINSFLGKMLRITVSTSATGPLYTSPSDNPYVGVAGLDEIYAIGLRNPWRWSFDRANGNMWIADVGQGAWEEVNFRTPANAKGVNYGWHCYEGMHDYTPAACDNDSINPIFEYPHSSTTGGFSITGGYVYRGTEYAASLGGWYICADYVSGNQFFIYALANGGWYSTMQPRTAPGSPTLPSNISTFGEAEDGTLYAASLTGGTVYKVDVVAFSPLPARLIEFTARPVNEVVKLSWKTSFEENLAGFEIEYSTDGSNFQQAGMVAALNNTGGAEYSFSHTPPSRGRAFYRLKIKDIDGQFEYSGIVSVQFDRPTPNFVQPSVISSGMMNVYLPGPFNSVELINMNGAILLKQNISGRSGRMDISLPYVPAGNYIVQLKNNETTLRQKILIRQ